MSSDYVQVDNGTKKRVRGAPPVSKVANYRLVEQRKEISRQYEVEKRINPMKKTDMAMINTKLANFTCCNKKSLTMGNCVLQAFTRGNETDFTAAISLLLRSQKMLENKSKQEKDVLIQEIYRKCVIGQDKQGNNIMKYLLGGSDTPVCKYAYAFSYGITVKALEKVSSALKASELGRVKDVNIKSYSDHTIHPHTIGEATRVFQSNLQRDIVGMHSILNYISGTIFSNRVLCVFRFFR